MGGGGHYGRPRLKSSGLRCWIFARSVASASLGQTDHLSWHGGLSIYWPAWLTDFEGVWEFCRRWMQSLMHTHTIGVPRRK